MSARTTRLLWWALSLAGWLLALLLTLGANAQLRRIDTLEARLLAVEKATARTDARQEAHERGHR